MTYNPARISEAASLEELRRYIEEELEKVSKEFNETIALDLRTVHQEPSRPREGMIASADGTDWDPGAGAGAYEFINGVWRRVAGLEDGDYGDVTVTGGVVTIDNNVVSLAKLAQVATARILGRITAGTGNVEALTGTQVTTLLDVFTSALKGLVPASGGGTTNFLRADGTFAAPPASSSVYKEELALSGANVVFDNVPAHDAVFIQVAGASHDSGSLQALQLELSNNNGSGWSAATTLTGTVTAATPLFQGIEIGTNSGAHFITMGGVNFGARISLSGALDAFRLSFTGGNFDAGNALLTAMNL